jgi:hypothetical protein
MVRPERFELPTYSSGGCRSIQLSYGRTPIFPVYMRSIAASIELDRTSTVKRRVSGSLDLNILTIASEEILIAIPATAPTAVPGSASPAISPPPTTASAALDLRTRFIHIQRSSADLSAVQRCNGLLSVFCTRHLHEAEASRAPGIAVSHNADAVNLSVYLEELAQFVFRCVEIEVPNKDVLHAIASE